MYITRSRLGSGFAVLLVLCTLLATAAVDLPGQQVAPTLIRDVAVFDGTSARGPMDVLVRDGRIGAMGPDLEVPAGSVVVEGRGRTLLPGLIDAHTHAFGDALREALVFGVTTELDMFTDAGFARQMRSEQAGRGAATRADLFSAGTLVTAPGGHGTEYGMVIPTLEGPEQAQAFVDARLAEGSDWIKIVYDDGHAYGLDLPTLDLATLRAAIDAAHARDVLAVVHVGDAAAAEEAIAAGADALVHLFTDEAAAPGFAERVAQSGAFIVPTLTVLRSVTGQPGAAGLTDDPAVAPYLMPASRTNLGQAFPDRSGQGEARYQVAADAVERLHAAGVAILAGTDAPNPGTAHGSALHRELELLVDAGLTPAEALRAATEAPARAFALEDRGRIAEGLRADLLLVDGDPLTDIRATRAIAGIWKGGVRVDRDAYAAAVAAASTTSAPSIPAEGLMLSDFDAGALTAALGSWMPSSDSFAGGASTGEVRVESTADGQALVVRGTISDKIAYPWYGAMWVPGSPPMTPVDLAGAEGFRFRTRGDGGTYRVLLFSQGNGMMPLIRTFTAEAGWTEVVMTWADFGIDGGDVMGLVWSGGPEVGAFEFVLDDVTLR
ncbi:MAG: CIA30 family protein [Gemmatimonadota bacterium]